MESFPVVYSLNFFVIAQNIAKASFSMVEQLHSALDNAFEA
jgi:hypothetical protein